jgi:uncharacterized protein YjbJ (UPF0337 family)
MSANSDKIKGTAKLVEGKLTGDKVRAAEGALQRAKGDIEGAVARIAHDVKRGVRHAKAELRRVDRARRR